MNLMAYTVLLFRLEICLDIKLLQLKDRVHLSELLDADLVLGSKLLEGGEVLRGRLGVGGLAKADVLPEVAEPGGMHSTKEVLAEQ